MDYCAARVLIGWWISLGDIRLRREREGGERGAGLRGRQLRVYWLGQAGAHRSPLSSFYPHLKTMGTVMLAVGGAWRLCTGTRPARATKVGYGSGCR